MREQLSLVGDIRIKRWIQADSKTPIELVGFSDACTKAYAAVIYALIRVNGENIVTLLTSKTRVAPMKKVTLPRLELCAAELLSKLMKKVRKALKREVKKITYYSDSEVTLAWIRGDPNRWKTYVANRVHCIQRNSDKFAWKYVNTKDNSADCASRGMLPEALLNHKLWWNGPDFLKNETSVSQIEFETDQEQRNEPRVVMAAQIEPENEIFSRFSTLNRAVRVIAWCERVGKVGIKSKILETEELIATKETIIKMCQRKYFANEIKE